MMDKNIKIASVDEIGFIVELAKSEGWNPGVEDALAFHIADPLGFYIYFSDNKPVGCISAVHYPHHYAFIGLYIVLKDYQHHGIGITLWQNALERLKNYNLGLDGVIAQQENYKKSGFKFAHKNIRFSGKSVQNEKLETIDARTIPFDILLKYVGNFFPVNPSFLAIWFGLKSHQSRVLLIDGEIKGVGVIRKCFDGYKIGPLFAETAHDAEKIFLDLCSLIGEGEIVFLDVPEPNKFGMQLVQSFLMQPVFETARMYNQHPLHVDLNRVFGITTFELG